ncbi:MAG: mechanosensitive ion channel [Chitinophagaceae bacterium]|nr:mechanosensitive ion channel [Chitinophagaceae bacterium]
MDVKAERKFNSLRNIGIDKKGRNKVKAGSYFLAALITIVFYFLIHLHILPMEQRYEVPAAKLALGAFVIAFVLGLSQVFTGIVSRKSKHAASAYNLIHLIRFFTFILIALLIVSIVFVKWYAAAVSLGLISLILGFALQTPISSFIGWIYILVRAPYHVGDRIQIDTFKGEVVEAGCFGGPLGDGGGAPPPRKTPGGGKPAPPPPRARGGGG